jgi:hypothetical protein
MPEKISRRRHSVDLGPNLDPSLVAWVDQVFHGENLVQVILSAHLLIERALIAELSHLVARPDLLERIQWKFAQRATLYVALADPRPELAELLFGFNKLRNRIAHSLVDEAESVAECLPWQLDEPAPEPRRQVWIAAALLLGALGAIGSIARLEPGSSGSGVPPT